MEPQIGAPNRSASLEPRFEPLSGRPQAPLEFRRPPADNHFVTFFAVADAPHVYAYVAAAYLFLMESGFATGQTTVVDGGAVLV